MAKSNKKNIPKSINEMSKEKLEEVLMKKKKCNSVAHKIVVELCEMNIDENWFLRNLQHINQSHFDDVIIERAILKLCGYPLCDNKIEKLMQQQYHISTRYNKVFDITERKKFCSNVCYKAASHVKNQLFTSPLWFRDQEVIPKYTILKANISALGEEVTFFPYKITLGKEDINLSEKTEVQKNKHNSENDIIIKNFEKKVENQNLKEIRKVELVCENTSGGNNSSNFCENSDFKSLNNTSQKNIMPTENKLLLTKTDLIKKNKIENKLDVNELNKIQTKNDNEIFFDIEKETKESCTCNEKNMQIKNNIKESENAFAFFDGNKKIENAVFEWVSLGTLFLLFGDKKLKNLLGNCNSQIKEALDSKLKYTISYDDKIEKLIKLYELLELRTSNNILNKPNLKPLPDYKAIQKESKSLNIKVKAFYNGSLEINNSLIEKSKTCNEENETETDNCLPLIDSQAQNSLRRKILLDKLGRVLLNLMQLFNKDYIIQISEIKKLVSTFNLTAHNITFRPAEWTLVGLILIKLLSIKNKHLNTILNTQSSQWQLELLLTSFNLEKNYLDSFINNLMKSEVIIKKLV